MKTFKQFISEKGFGRRVCETIGVRDYVNAVDIINKSETNPLKKDYEWIVYLKIIP